MKIIAAVFLVGIFMIVSAGDIFSAESAIPEQENLREDMEDAQSIQEQRDQINATSMTMKEKENDLEEQIAQARKAGDKALVKELIRRLEDLRQEEIDQKKK